jgi:hypothetical protein
MQKMPREELPFLSNKELLSTTKQKENPENRKIMRGWDIYMLTRGHRIVWLQGERDVTSIYP